MVGPESGKEAHKLTLITDLDTYDSHQYFRDTIEAQAA